MVSVFTLGPRARFRGLPPLGKRIPFLRKKVGGGLDRLRYYFSRLDKVHAGSTYVQGLLMGLVRASGFGRVAKKERDPVGKKE